MKKVVHQFHANASSRDAIGENMLTLQREFRQLGYESEIFCMFCTGDMEDLVIKFDKYSEYSSPNNVLIIHYSIGFEGLDDLLSIPDRKILVYHNITPPEFLQEYSPMIARTCAEGLKSLEKFKGRVDQIVGDSTFNLQNLHEMGFEGGEVVPILFNFKKFQIPPDPGVLKKINNDGRVNWLFVGKLFPNKMHDDLLRVFYYFNNYINPNSRLILVGAYKHLRVYYEYLRHMVYYLNMENVIFAGSVSDSKLIAYYQSADLFMSMSEHEGFCVPLLEAIYAGIPIMAYNSSAVPETLGGTGVLIKEKKFPEIAELAQYILENHEFRHKMVEAQKERLQAFSPDTVLQKWLKILHPFF